MDLLALANLLFRTFPSLRKMGWVRRIVTLIGVQRATRHVPPRPYPYSMRPDYTTWRSLTDRRITGRHLPCPVADQYVLPKIEEVAKLFPRPKGTREIPCPRSSLLFAAFAQWFTDSFLRTEPNFEYNANGNVPRDVNGRLIRKPGREALNNSNHEIDLCQIYGSNEDETTLLRIRDPEPEQRGFLDFQTDDDGQVYPRFILRSAVPRFEPLDILDRFDGLHDERLLRVVFDDIDKKEPRSIKMFAVGLEHGNVTLGNSLFNTIFLREHNRVAAEIGAKHGEWDDERVFQTTRNVMIVLLLKVVIADYISHLSPWQMPLTLVHGHADRQHWYRTNRISIEFDLLYRWHELIPDKIEFLEHIGDYKHNNGWLLDHGVEELIDHLSTQRAGMITLGNTPVWLEGVLKDTLEIMRNSRLASYNDYRRRFGLSPAKRFEDVTTNPDRLKKLKALYPDIDGLEWFVGMYAEDVQPGSISGELMRSMVGYDAFTHALTNPLLATGVYGAGTFSEEGMAIIDSTESLDQLVRRNTRDREFACSFQAPS